MFSESVAATGRIRKAERRKGGLRLTVGAGRLPLRDGGIGDSIAVNGVCLTVVARAPKALAWTCPRNPALHRGLDEPANQPSRRRCGCPTVSAAISFGHVDGVGKVTHSGAAQIAFFGTGAASPRALYRAQGLDHGARVSLTVNAVRGAEFEVNLIPHTSADDHARHLRRATASTWSGPSRHGTRSACSAANRQWRGRRDRTLMDFHQPRSSGGRALAPHRSFRPSCRSATKREEIAKAISSNLSRHVCGETARADHQLPKICLDITAAASTAYRAYPAAQDPRAPPHRVAQELKTEPGRSRRLKIRFTDKVGPRCYIKIMTDGSARRDSRGSRAAPVRHADHRRGHERSLTSTSCSAM